MPPITPPTIEAVFVVALTSEDVPGLLESPEVASGTAPTTDELGLDELMVAPVYEVTVIDPAAADPVRDDTDDVLDETGFVADAGEELEAEGAGVDDIADDGVVA